MELPNKILKNIECKHYYYRNCISEVLEFLPEMPCKFKLNVRSMLIYSQDKILLYIVFKAYIFFNNTNQ